MAVKRIIPCLDVHQGRVVKGINFIGLKDAGDPVELAHHYDLEGADELVFLDISASDEKRKIITEVVKQTARGLSIPLTVGGGIGSIDDISRLLAAGAAKVSIGSAAVGDPNLISAAARHFGTESIIVAIDARRSTDGDDWEVFINGGKKPTGWGALKWAQKVESLGAGEILLTSMDRDGTRDGYDLELTAAVSDSVQIPVIASGGAGNLRHLYEAIQYGHASAVLCASIFHYREYTIREAKQFLREKGVAVKDD